MTTPGEPKVRPFVRSRSSAEARRAREEARARAAEEAKKAARRTAAAKAVASRARVAPEERAPHSHTGASMPGLAALGRAGARAAQQSGDAKQGRREQRASRTGGSRSSRRARRDLSWAPRRRGRAGLWAASILVLVLVVACGVFVGVQALRPVPGPHVAGIGANGGPPASLASVVVPGAPPAIPWPAGAEGEVQVPGLGTFGPVGGSSPIAIGSVAKIMTAYVVLHDHPLSGGAQGPSITVTPADVSLYQSDLSQGDSVAAVVAGEQITERQALEALLIPSGDNIAAMLAKWDAGSVTAFLARMNSTAAKLGMGHTHYADASGLAPQTVSTPGDQLRLVPLAMANPVFASIVAMPEATLPVAGRVTNYNGLLGKDGVIGVKTGSTPAAAGCLVFAARHKVGARTLTIYGALLGVKHAPGQGLIAAALAASQHVVTAVEAAIKPVTILPAGRAEARVLSPWGSTAPARTTKAVTLVGWPGLRATVSTSVSGRLRTPTPSGTVVGHASVHLGDQQQTVPLRTSRAVPAPELSWRLQRGL